jgi:hypothetical protein
LWNLLPVIDLKDAPTVGSCLASNHSYPKMVSLDTLLPAAR